VAADPLGIAELSFAGPSKIFSVILNTVTFIDKCGPREHKHCDNAANNVNSEKGRSRMVSKFCGEV
jgi:hypothetical protein